MYIRHEFGKNISFLGENKLRKTDIEEGRKVKVVLYNPVRECLEIQKTAIDPVKNRELCTATPRHTSFMVYGF